MPWVVFFFFPRLQPIAKRRKMPKTWGKVPLPLPLGAELQARAVCWLWFFGVFFVWCCFCGLFFLFFLGLGCQRGEFFKAFNLFRFGIVGTWRLQNGAWPGEDW